MLRLFIFFLVFFSSHSPLFSQFDIYNLANTGESVNEVTSIGVLNSGYVYIGTKSAGLVEFNGVSTWSSFNESNSGLPNDYISSIYINSSDVWIATEFGGIGKYSGGVWSEITQANTANKLPVDEVWGMQLDPTTGNLCIATFAGFVIDSIPNGNWRTFKMSNTAALETENFYTILVDPAGVVWLGTVGKGLATFASDTWQFYKTQNSGIANDTVKVIKRSTDGNYWIGTDEGVSKFNGSTWTNYTVSSTGGGLPGNQINSIAFDNAGNVFVGTDNGLGVFHKASGLWSSYTSSNSNLPESNIKAVAINSNTQDVWIGTATLGVAVAVNNLLLSNEKEVKVLENLNLYPNPVNDRLNINFTCIKESDVQISIIDLYGKVVFDFGTVNYSPGQYNFSKDFSGMAKGMYVLHMSTQEGKITKSIQVY